MKTDDSSLKILKILLKNLTIKPTITSLSKEIGMSRVGMWKVLKKLEAEKIILLNPIGYGKTSIYSISLNWENPLTDKTLALALTEEALRNKRWMHNFLELEDKLDFLIIHGSILHSPKEAEDIDIIGITSKNKFVEIEESVKKIQKTQVKKIHIINFTEHEFKQELTKPNKAFIDAVNKGLILFGQEEFIRFMKNLSRR